MVNFNMIDTQSSGIQKVFRIQRDKYFPMPDYDTSSKQQVEVKVYGKSLNEAYMHILYNNPDMPLETVFLLDRVQKGFSIEKDAADFLRRKHLIEGRYPKIFPSATVSKTTEDEAQYIRNKAFDDKYYKDMIVEYLKKYGKGQKKDFKELLWSKLPDILTDKQKDRKISNLLSSLKRENIVTTDSPNHQISCWTLKRELDNNN